MARVTDRLVFELAQMMYPRGRPTKDGLKVETKIGALLTLPETEAMGLGQASLLAEDYESAKPRLSTGRARVVLTPKGMPKHELRWEVEDVKGFTFTMDKDDETIWCEFVVISRPPLTPIAEYWDLCGRARGRLTVEPVGQGEQSSVLQSSVEQAVSDFVSTLELGGLDSVTITAGEHEPVTITKDDAKRMRKRAKAVIQ